MTAPVASLPAKWRAKSSEIANPYGFVTEHVLGNAQALDACADELEAALASPAGEGGLPEFLDEDAAVIRGLESIANDPERGLWSQSLSRGALRIIRRLATTAGVQGEDWQQRCLDLGFKYWRAPDAHGVECTHEQALALLRDLLGVEVDFTTPPPAPAAEQGDETGPYPFGAGLQQSPAARYWQQRSEFWMGKAISLGWREVRDAENGEGPATQPEARGVLAEGWYHFRKGKDGEADDFDLYDIAGNPTPPCPECVRVKIVAATSNLAREQPEVQGMVSVPAALLRRIAAKPDAAACEAMVPDRCEAICELHDLLAAAPAAPGVDEAFAGRVLSEYVRICVGEHDENTPATYRVKAMQRALAAALAGKDGAK